LLTNPRIHTRTHAHFSIPSMACLPPSHPPTTHTTRARTHYTHMHTPHAHTTRTLHTLHTRTLHCAAPARAPRRRRPSRRPRRPPRTRRRSGRGQLQLPAGGLASRLRRRWCSALAMDPLRVSCALGWLRSPMPSWLGTGPWGVVYPLVSPPPTRPRPVSVCH